MLLSGDNLNYVNLLLIPAFLLLITGCGNSTTAPIRDESTTGIKSKFINETVCDLIIDKEFLEICYDNELKAAKSVAYTLSGDLVNELNIKDRPYFYVEESVEKAYRINYSDYTNSGYDRGHLAPDAAFDWSTESLEATYSLANIIPQVPEVNRDMWVDVERYARIKAVDLGRVNILNIVKYNSTPNRMGSNAMAISEGFYKVLYNEDDAYEECYYYANEANENSLTDKRETHLVDCRTILN